MHKRHLSATILFGAVFSLMVASMTLALAEPGVPGDTSSTNSAAPSVAPSTPPPAAVSAPGAASAPATVTGGTMATADRPTTYTVVSGDSLWLIAHKYDCSVASLKKLNKLTTNNLKIGKVLKLPPAQAAKTATPPSTTPAAAVKPGASVTPKKHAKSYARAQPVQDFDIPASTFASCPVPVPTQDEDEPSSQPSEPDSGAVDSTAPVAKLVSPAELASVPKPEDRAPEAVSAPVADESAPETSSAPTAKITGSETPPVEADSTAKPAGPRAKSGFNFFSMFTRSTPTVDWGSRFLQEARALADRDIDYDEAWRPPGESRTWEMDCSNTSRYLYKVTAGIELPRTASDQYYNLHVQNKAWDVPQTADGFADCNYLRENLKPGDLLFWENTYRPERQPPITHVMIFLGTNEKGEWIMAGSQTSRGGEHNRSNGGPDVYVFNPTQPCGGYTTWLGLVHHQGRFCAFGRPLEADPAKLAVASNE